MSDKEQVFQFGDELDKLIDRFRSEYDITMASAVGTLHFKAFLLMREAEDKHDAGESDDPHEPND